MDNVTVMRYIANNCCLKLHFWFLHSAWTHKVISHEKESFNKKKWGNAGFTIPKLIHVLKQSGTGSAVKTKPKIFNATSLKIIMFTYFSTCASSSSNFH